MTRLAIVLVIALVSVVGSRAAEIVDVGTRKQLFVDDHVVAKRLYEVWLMRLVWIPELGQGEMSNSFDGRDV